jgi:hypothetical protein
MKKIGILALLISVSMFLAFNSPYVATAVKFLNALDQDQRVRAQLPFDDLSKTQWHYLPGSMWPREGIKIADLSEDQKTLLHELLQTSLSKTGYTKTVKIMDLENVLLELSGDPVMRDPGKYAVAFYGNPENDSLWAWSFEGHHISLNFTVLNGLPQIAPRFFGANPATIPSGSRKGERTLIQEEDLGLELIRSLNDKQRDIAIFQNESFFDIVTANSEEVSPLNPVGIKFKELNNSQQLVFLHLIDLYLSAMPPELARERMKSISNEEVGEMRFGWAGATVLGEGHYYRIQGKSFLIEFDNTQNNANHIHTVWRDFEGDFGRDLIREHYQHSDHHKQ